jgi:hypothetical protein
MDKAVVERTRAGERGFALIVALLALLLLTFLGLTLAAVTSSELQIATNYRWSQQALYNAEAGASAVKLMLRSKQDWAAILPPARPGTWTVGSPATSPGVPTWAAGTESTLRHYENQGCDGRGGHVGYGAILGDPDAGVGAGVAWQYLSQPAVNGVVWPKLNGAFTAWVRRSTNSDTAGNLSDSTDNDRIVLTVEGVAPFTSGAAVNSEVGRSTVAVKTIELTLTRAPGDDQSCADDRGQTGAAASGAGFYGCGGVTGGATGSLRDVLSKGAGNVTGSGVPQSGGGSGTRK